MCRNPNTHIALEITVSWSRLSGPATQQQLCSLERDKMKLRPSGPFNTVRYLGPKPIKQRKTQPCVAQQRRSAELGHVVVGTSTAVHAMYAYGGEEFYLLRFTNVDLIGSVTILSLDQSQSSCQQCCDCNGPILPVFVARPLLLWACFR